MFGRSITVTVVFPDPPKPRHLRELEKLEKQALQNQADAQAVALKLQEQQTKAAEEAKHLPPAEHSPTPVAEMDETQEVKKAQKMDPYLKMLHE
jgi:hypothetical protein